MDKINPANDGLNGANELRAWRDEGLSKLCSKQKPEWQSAIPRQLRKTVRSPSSLVTV
jgi:hypothetical protein